MTLTRECNAVSRCCWRFCWISAIAAFWDAKSSSRSSVYPVPPVDLPCLIALQRTNPLSY
eukprot:10522349-Ditylum_brightwellii.AAC.1